MEPVVIALPAFQVVGVSFAANLRETEEQQLVKKAYAKLLSRAEEIKDRTGEEVYLIQIYPNKPDFNVMVDAFKQVIGYKVSNADNVPSEMIHHLVPENEYVKLTHKGIESELGSTYEYLYGQWLPKSGRQFGSYDFEIWDDRYQPDRQENEIDVYVAVK